MSYDDLKNKILELTGVHEDDFDPDGDLVDFGLDSIQVLTLTEEWRELGIDIELSDLIPEPTLNGWWRVLETKVGTFS